MPLPSTMTPIATNTLTAAGASVTFSSIPQGYTDLILQVNNQMSGGSGFKLRFNSDSGSNYSLTYVSGYAGAAYSGRISNGSSITNNLVYGDSVTANVFTPNIIQIQNYSNTTTYKSLLWRYGSVLAAAGTTGDVTAIVGVWRSTAAITSIEITPWNAVNFNSGSTFTLYGIKAA